MRKKLNEFDIEFDVCCKEYKDMKDSFDEWIKDGNVIKFEDGYATQDAQYRNRLKDKKELYKYFIKEFGNIK